MINKGKESRAEQGPATPACYILHTPPAAPTPLRRLAVFKGDCHVSALPPYLTVQMVRFYYKADVQQKAKILRKVSCRVCCVQNRLGGWCVGMGCNAT